jgi:hypothetical protein
MDTEVFEVIFDYHYNNDKYFDISTLKSLMFLNKAINRKVKKSIINVVLNINQGNYLEILSISRRIPRSWKCIINLHLPIIKECYYEQFLISAPNIQEIYLYGLIVIRDTISLSNVNKLKITNAGPLVYFDINNVINVEYLILKNCFLDTNAHINSGKYVELNECKVKNLYGGDKINTLRLYKSRIIKVAGFDYLKKFIAIESYISNPISTMMRCESMLIEKSPTLYVTIECQPSLKQLVLKDITINNSGFPFAPHLEILSLQNTLVSSIPHPYPALSKLFINSNTLHGGINEYNLPGLKVVQFHKDKYDSIINSFGHVLYKNLGRQLKIKFGAKSDLIELC